MLELKLWLAWTLSVVVVAVDPLVDLAYVQYEGTPLTNGITQWLGMRYATAPVGLLRFAAPQNPPSVSGIQTADQHGKLCLATADSPIAPSTSEDCLFLDVYAPSSATSQSRLPVYLFIQGGGFNSNSNPNFNGSGLITASGSNIVVVTFNYRVGPYGFLASSEVQKNPTASINNGLKDQRQALKWLQKHVASFGGDPDHVVLGGDSAGAASIAYHLTAFGGQNEKLFVGAAAESVSFGPVLTITESQYQFDYFVSKLGCAKSADKVSCLRQKSVSDLQEHNSNIPYPGADNPPLFMWNPVIDGDLIKDYPYRAFDEGKFIKVPLIVGDDTNAGTVFAPRSANSMKASNIFLHDQFPALTSNQLKRIDALFPNRGLKFPNSGTFWRQLSDAYGEMRYTCPGLFVSSALQRNGSDAIWAYRYNVEDEQQIQEGLGVPHTVELNAIWGPENVNGKIPASYKPGGSNVWAIPVLQGYWTSFIRSLDPNTHRYVGTPTWEKWVDSNQKRILFEKNKLQMEGVDAGQAMRCRYLQSIGVAVKQ